MAPQRAYFHCGRCPIYRRINFRGARASDLIRQGFIHTPALRALVGDTQPVTAIDVGAFDAIVVAGGQAPMFTFEQATSLHETFTAFW